MKGDQAAHLGQPAVFATGVRAFAAQAPEGGAHLCRTLAKSGAGLDPQHREEGVCGNDGFKFAPLLRRDNALRIAVRQLVKARLFRGIGLEVGHGLQQFIAQAAGERSQHPTEDRGVDGWHGEKIRS